MMKPAVSAAIFAMLLLIIPVPVSADSQQQHPAHLTFGFLPIVSPERLVRRFYPLVAYLSGELGIEIRMETAPDFLTFVQRTHDEKRYDILFTAPHLYYLAHNNHGYRAVARVDSPGMQAVIVAPRERGIKSVKDLRGRRLATTDPLALATVLVRAKLEESGINPATDLTMIPTPSHNASLLSTHRGVTDAAALILPVFRRASPDIRDTMIIVAKTRMVPHMPISVAPWIDDVIAAHVSEALIALSTSPNGRSLLSDLDWRGFVSAREDEYATLGPMSDALTVR